MLEAIASSTTSGITPTPLIQFGSKRYEALLNVQKQVLNEIEEAGHAWIARVKSELDLWSELARKVTGSQSIPEGLQAYQDFAAQHVKKAIEDGCRLFADGQRLVTIMTKTLNGQSKTADQQVQDF